MKENLILLAKLLATDISFNLAFSSKVTSEEKYELSKTKITSLTHEDFSEFLEKLQEAQEKELSPEELEQIAGGGLVNKLATAALLLTTVVLPTATQSVSASVPEFHKELTAATDQQFDQKIKTLSNLENVYRDKSIGEDSKYPFAFNDNGNRTKQKKAKTNYLQYFMAIKSVVEYLNGPKAFRQELLNLGVPPEKSNSDHKDNVKEILKTIWVNLAPNKGDFQDKNCKKCVWLLWTRLKANLDIKKKTEAVFAENSLNAIKYAAKELENTDDNCWDCEKIFNENFRVNGNIEFYRKKTPYKLSKGRLNHILNGDFEARGFLTGGGHTSRTIKRLEDIMNAQLTALKAVADEADNQLWVEKWLNAFADGNRQADSINLKPESTEQNGVMHYKLKYAEFSGGNGEQTKTVFPKHWDAEKIMDAMSRCIQEGICLQKPLEVVGPAYAAVVDGVAVVVYINSDNTISSCYPLDVQPESSFEGEFFDCEYETIIAAGKKEKQTFHLPMIK